MTSEASSQGQQNGKSQQDAAANPGNADTAGSSGPTGSSGMPGEGGASGPGTAGAMCPAGFCANVDWVGGFELAKQVVSDPIGVWKKVKPEPWTVKDIYCNYLIPFSAIPAIAHFIGFNIFGPGFFFSGLIDSVLSYVATLGMAFLLAVVMKEVAGKLGGSLSLENSLKMIAVASLPGFFAGAVLIIPWLILALIPVLAGLAGGYAFYQGIPEMTGIPETKRLQFFCVLVATAIVCSLILQKVM